MLFKLATVLLLAASVTAAAVEPRQAVLTYKKCPWRDSTLTQEEKNGHCDGRGQICVGDKSMSNTMNQDGICVLNRACNGLVGRTCQEGYHCQDIEGDGCNMTPGDNIDEGDPVGADCIGVCVANSFNIRD